MLVQYLGIISIFNLLILSFYLFFKSNRNKERNRLLSLIVFFIAYTQFVFLFYLTGKITSYPFLSYTEAIAINAVMPLFYIYLNQLLENKPVLVKHNFYHLIPVLPALFYCIYFSSFSSDMQQASLKTKTCGNIPDFYLYILSSISQITYCIISLKKLNSFYFSYKSRLTKDDKKELNWHFILVYGFLILAAAFIALYLAVPDEHQIDVISTIILDLLFVFILIFLLNRSSDYYFDLESFENNKVQKQNIKAAELKNVSLAEFIGNEIKSKKLYLRNLNLAKLSMLLSVPEYKISQCINQEYKMSVPDYINFLRVETAKDILAKDALIKMDFLAKECGFSTRTSFYNAFKKFTNTTPATFKDLNLMKK